MATEETKGTLVDDLLNRTNIAVREGDLHRLRAAITDAWTAKVQHSLANIPEFRQHLSLLTTHVAGQDDEQLVLALAEMGRLHTIKSMREWVEGLAAQLLSNGFPASFQYGDGKQRFYAAVAVVSSGVSVELDVLARSVVEEEKGENARREWIVAMLERAPLSEVFEYISRAIIVTDGMSSQSRPLRLQHILATLNAQFVQVDIQIDDGFCDGFRNFIAKAYFNAPRPQEYRTSALAVEELAKTAIQLIRLRYRLGADPDFYGALALAERWVSKGGWIRLTSTSATLRQLRRTLLEGLVLLLEQGKPDYSLLEAHRALSPNKKLAQKELKESEASARNLSPELRRWLVSGGTKMLVAKTAELNETDDLSIAMAMIVANELSHRMDVSVDALLNDIRFKAPVHIDTITSVLDLTKQLVDRLSFLADRRQLRLFGSPGEVVDFTPQAYRLPDNAPLARRVQIQSPGVEKLGRSASSVVVPALVEAVN